MSQFIHGGFYGIEPGHSSKTAHIPCAADVSFSAAKGHTQIGHAVLESSRFTTILVMGIQHRPRVDIIVLQRDQFSLPRGAETHTLSGKWPMADSVERQFAREHQPYWPACLSGSGRGKGT